MASKRYPHEPEPTTSGTGEVIVLVSMALVVAAIVVGLHVQMGLALPVAAIVGMALFVGLVGFYAWRRSEAERDQLSGELRRLQAEIVLLRPAARALGPDPYLPHVSVPLPAMPPYADAPAAHGANDDPGLADAAAASGPALAEVAAPAPEAWPHEPPHFEAYRGVPPVAPGESLNDYWSFRPSDPTLEAPAPLPDVAVAAPERPDANAAPEARSSTSVREDDVEMLQRRIKDMLYQVTVAEQAREIAAALPAADDAAEAPPVAALGVEASLGALRAAAQSMRRPAGAEAAPAAPPPVPAAAAPAADLPEEPPADPHLAAVREAIAAGRADVYLEPILALGDQATQHYEVSIRLRGPATEDLGTGEDGLLSGRGILPLFDAARVTRSAIVAERLASRGKRGSVFSRASGEALIEPDFTRNMQMDFVARPATARQLILSFTQSDIRSFRAAEQRSVSALAALGFRFAISSLTDLDMNFEAMAKAGFGFVKIDAGVLMHGLAHPGGHVPPGDVCRFLADHGFGLIVVGIDSEETLARVFGFGVLLGQGTLFGGRRPVKADVVVKSGHATAA